MQKIDDNTACEMKCDIGCVRKEIYKKQTWFGQWIEDLWMLTSDRNCPYYLEFKSKYDKLFED